MGNEVTYPLEPKDVPPVDTNNRKICTKIPVPESIPLLKRLREYEPVSMQGQPLILWDHADKCFVYDKYGNKWLDLSSGVLVTNAGHSRKEIIDAIVNQVNHGLIHNYVFPSEVRLNCIEKILSFAPNYLNKVFLLTTGSEATECALKLARTYAQKQGNSNKNIFITFENAFHGRTLGAQLMGGIPALKDWIKNRDEELIQVPFPDGFYNENTSFDLFQETLENRGIFMEDVCGVMTETYQGGGADFLPKKYAQELRKWCTEAGALLIFDEIQAGFGRTGKRFGFMHYEVEPDLVCLGKGISSGLPISGVLGKKEILDIYPPGSMTSTHTGNPVSCAAVIANIDLIIKEKLVENAEKVGALMHKYLQNMVDTYPSAGVCHGKGLVAGLQMVKPRTKTPDPQKAFEVCKSLVEKGVMVFSPVGKATVKICPPLCITEEQIKEAMTVLESCLKEAS